MLATPLWGLIGEPAKVLNVIDGDTLIIRYHDHVEHLRLLGIDAPESHRNEKLERQTHGNATKIQIELEKGAAATAFMRAQVHRGDPIGLVFDEVDRDKYDRLLAYVYLANTRLLNQVMLDAGHARRMTIPPNTHFPTSPKLLPQ